jgi:hypothetical protein
VEFTAAVHVAMAGSFVHDREFGPAVMPGIRREPMVDHATPERQRRVMPSALVHKPGQAMIRIGFVIDLR